MCEWYETWRLAKESAGPQCEIVNKEMAALPAGVQYGLSSESSYKENKELVFVKLTDSALKAIEDFIRNRVSPIAILLWQK